MLEGDIYRQDRKERIRTMTSQEYDKVNRRFCEVRIKMLQVAMRYDEPHPPDYMTLHDCWMALTRAAITVDVFAKWLMKCGISG
jgi:hypothetical protein